MASNVRIFLGFDQREAAAYHVCCQSILDTASVPVSFHPLNGAQRDGSNAFTFARYLVPFMCDFTGWALFLDGDMVVEDDIAKLWSYRHSQYDKAVCVVKHNYQTKHAKKYIDSSMESPNVDYPRKNWSSVMLFNCSHFGNRVLTPEMVAESPASYLHRLQWLRDDQIGELGPEWNRLIGESHEGGSLLHYTLGVPGFKHYSQGPRAFRWHRKLLRALECGGEDPTDMVKRAL